jgi:hypothetical protein
MPPPTPTADPGRARAPWGAWVAPLASAIAFGLVIAVLHRVLLAHLLAGSETDLRAARAEAAHAAPARLSGCRPGYV